jgi:hypothetical protein
VGGMRFGEAVGRIGEDSVMVVRVHQLVDHVGGRFELGVFVVALFERGKCRGKVIGQEIRKILILIYIGKFIL